MTKADKAERDEAIGRLRGMLKPGDTLFTTIRHVARSGMSRDIDLHKIENGTPHWLSRLAAKATGFRFNDKRECLTVGGCGMDMGFHLVYECSATLYPDGFGCIGEGCPSNDHSNGDRDYTPHKPTGLLPRCEHWHREGGYALRHRWL